MTDPNRRLGPHFIVREFADHSGALPPASSIPALTDLVTVYLEPLRERFGRTVVNSGYRTPARNAAVGGAPRSKHVYTWETRTAAADVSCALGRPRDWYLFLDRLDPGGLGAYPSHVHVDNRAIRARW